MPNRFGLEGCEAALPGLQTVVRTCSENGVGKIEIGLAHRGRLNILCNLLDKPLGAVCGEMLEQNSGLPVGEHF